MGTSEKPNLKNRNGDFWEKPEGATEDHVYLTVTCMEAWFMADKETLKKYYGQHFESLVLPSNHNVEQIPKGDLLKALEQATSKTQKGKYSKGEYSFSILAEISPQKVMESSEKAKEMLSKLKELSQLKEKAGR